MEITITVNGKQVKAYVNDNEIAEAIKENLKPKKTGYERGEKLTPIFSAWGDGTLYHSFERNLVTDAEIFENANYYTDSTVAGNNAKADLLMRKLRRFAAIHGGCVSCKNRNHENGLCYVISYHSEPNVLFSRSYSNTYMASPGEILFRSEVACDMAIKEFHDELMWYFTEYDPMPTGWWDND